MPFEEAVLMLFAVERRYRQDIFHRLDLHPAISARIEIMRTQKMTSVSPSVENTRKKVAAAMHVIQRV